MHLYCYNLLTILYRVTSSTSYVAELNSLSFFSFTGTGESVETLTDMLNTRHFSISTYGQEVMIP